MFTYPCFIRKYSKELCKKLEDLGLELMNSSDTTLDCHNYDGKGNHRHIDEGLAIITYSSNNYGVIYDIDDVTKKGRIDCGTNEGLFLAIAALRDDTDRDQYFLCKDSENDISIFRLEHKFDRLEQLFKEYWNEVKEEYKSEFDLYLIDYTLKKTFSRTRKMTVEELIEYFKRQRQ